MAARSVGSIPLEAVPFIGIGTIVGVTILDIKSFCDAMGDMAELRKEFALGQSEERVPANYCGENVPTASVLWQMVPSW